MKNIFSKKFTQEGSVFEYDGSLNHSQSEAIESLNSNLSKHEITRLTFRNPKLARNQTVAQKTASLVAELIDEPQNDNKLLRSYEALTSLEISGYDLSADTLDKVILLVNGAAKNLQTLVLKNCNLGKSDIENIGKNIFGDGRTNGFKGGNHGEKTNITTLDLSENNLDEESLGTVRDILLSQGGALKIVVSALSDKESASRSKQALLEEIEQLNSGQAFQQIPLPPRPHTITAAEVQKIDNDLKKGSGVNPPPKPPLRPLLERVETAINSGDLVEKGLQGQELIDEVTRVLDRTVGEDFVNTKTNDGRSGG